MLSLLESLLNFFTEKTERERDARIFYVKSLMFLLVIVVFISDRFFWKMSQNINSMLGEKISGYILNIVKLGAHFFTCLSIISFFVILIAAFLYLLVSKLSKNLEYQSYFQRLRIGSEFRFTYSLEDVILCLAIGYIFDKNFVRDYMDVYTNFIWICIFASCALEFLFSSVKGIIYRFFFLHPLLSDKTEDKNE